MNNLMRSATGPLARAKHGVLMAGLVVVGLGASLSVQARDVYWNVGVGVGLPGVSVGNAPVYAAPVYTAPVYAAPVYAAPPVYYAPPRPVYHVPPPVYYEPPPVYYEPPRYRPLRHVHRHTPPQGYYGPPPREGSGYYSNSRSPRAHSPNAFYR